MLPVKTLYARIQCSLKDTASNSTPLYPCASLHTVTSCDSCDEAGLGTHKIPVLENLLNKLTFATVQSNVAFHHLMSHLAVSSRLLPKTLNCNAAVEASLFCICREKV